MLLQLPVKLIKERRFYIMKNLVIFFISLLFIVPVLIFTEDRANASEGISENTNLHYTDKYCSECHENTPVEGGEAFLKYGGDYTQLCKCHGYTPGTYIHPVDIIPSEEKKNLIPEEFPLVNDKIACPTCHDMYMQCQKNPRFKVLNRRFLRGAPYVSRTTLCFRCHDEKQYTMLDPHNQLTKEGSVIVDKCLYCHVEKPDENISTFKEVKLIGNLEVLCFRCHYKQSQLHPINANHLVTPPDSIVENMKLTKEKYGIILPLNYDGRITCSTCHNPHERGVIPAICRFAWHVIRTSSKPHNA